MTAFPSISQAAKVGELTFRSGTTAVVKEGISTAVGEGASRITMELSGNGGIVFYIEFSEGASAAKLNSAQIFSSQYANGQKEVLYMFMRVTMKEKFG